MEYHGVATKIDPRAFEIALASELLAVQVKKVVVPDLVVVKSPDQGENSLHVKWRALQDARHVAWRTVGPLVADLARKDAELDAASRTGRQERVVKLTREVSQLRRRAEPLTETLGQAERRLSDLETQWTKVSETTGLTMMTRLLRAETIDQQTPRYLHAAVVSSGGHNRISRNLWRVLFWGDGLSSMGGVVVRWALLETEGNVRKGGILADRRAATFPMVSVGNGW